MRVKTAAGGHAMTDEEYNRKWFERLQARTVINKNGCWVWTGPVTHKGYPMQTHRSYVMQAHRVSYILKHGLTLTRQQFVCHKCDERRCWNPDHLFIGDAAANNRDCGNKGRHHNGVKTHCKRGHPFTFENTYLKVTPTTVMRSCLECAKIRRDWPHYKEKARERLRRRRARQRAEKMGAQL